MERLVVSNGISYIIDRNVKMQYTVFLVNMTQCQLLWLAAYKDGTPFTTL
jgi:hypothetical protein